VSPSGGSATTPVRSGFALADPVADAWQAANPHLLRLKRSVWRVRGVAGAATENAAMVRRDVLRFLPLTNTRPSWPATVSPGTPMTRSEIARSCDSGSGPSGPPEIRSVRAHEAVRPLDLKLGVLEDLRCAHRRVSSKGEQGDETQLRLLPVCGSSMRVHLPVSHRSSSGRRSGRPASALVSVSRSSAGEDRSQQPRQAEPAIDQ
jgi:hypothetical protein